MLELRIQLLGDFRLSDGDQLLTYVNTSRLQALLAYLILHRDNPQSRRRLAFLFWPDTTEAQALTNLRNLLHKLRQVLPEPDRFFAADVHAVYWRADAPCTLDVTEFESLAQSTTRADLEQAANLYRGDLLPGCYDDWIVPERERRQQMATHVLERVIEVLEAEGDSKAAIRYAQRLLQHDPLSEDAYRLLMRLHAANNDRASVLRIYHSCVTTLQNELAADPSPATHELYQRIFVESAPAMSVPARSKQPPLVGRRSEWQALHAAWQIASGGKPHCAILTGEAGIGKTRLAEEMLSWADRQGAIVAVARCYAAEGALAYAPVIAWLRSAAIHPRLLTLEPVWLTEVARLLPELLTERPDLPRPSPITEAAQRLRLFDALARALLGARAPLGARALRGTRAPLMLLIDNLEWCDRDTLEWLHYLLRFDPAACLLVIGTVRGEQFGSVTDGIAHDSEEHPLAALMSALHGDGQLTELELAPLDANETASLAAFMAERDLTSEQAARLFDETEGNPLFVVETLRFGLETRDQRPETGGGRTLQTSPIRNPPSLPPKVHAILQSRLSQLSTNARALAGLAAAIGREFTWPVLAHASDQDEQALVRSVDELWQRRIVRDIPGRDTPAYDFTHDKLREVAYNSQSATRRRLLHQRVAQAMESVHGPASDAVSGQIATHYELAGRFEQAIPHYQRAAAVAQRVYANDDAIRTYRRALALLATSGQDQGAAASLHEGLGDIWHWTCEYEQARADFRQALDATPQLEAIHRARLLRKIGNTWREQNRYQEALDAYADAERALGAVPSEPSPEWWHAWIQALLETNLVYYWLGLVSESDQLRARLQPAIEQYGTPSQRAVYFQNLSWIEFRRNRQVATAEMVTLVKVALAAQQEAGNQAGIPAAQFGVGFALLWSGDPQGAMEPLETALRQAELTGDVSLQARCLTYLTIAHRQHMQIEETQRHAARSLEVATVAQMPEYIAMAKANQGWLAWRAGDLVSAKGLAQAALDLWHQLPAGHASAPFQWLARWPLIAMALHEEQPSLAVDYARALLDPGQQRLPDALVTNLERAVQAWDEGAPDSARSLLHQSMELAQQMHYL